LDQNGGHGGGGGPDKLEKRGLSLWVWGVMAEVKMATMHLHNARVIGKGYKLQLRPSKPTSRWRRKKNDGD